MKHTLLPFALGALAACASPTRTPGQDAAVADDLPPASDGPTGGDTGARDVAADRVCTAGQISCADGVALACSADGATLTRTPCQAPDGVCFPGVGCRPCAPGATRCAGADPLLVQRCRADGAGWEDGARCDAAARMTCAAGACVDRCNAEALGRSHLGCTFWPTSTPNSGLDPMFEFAVALANPQTYRVVATVSGGALAAPREVALAPGATEVVTLPWVIPLVQLNPACMRVGMACVNPSSAASALVARGAYRVQSDGPIAAYQFNPLTSAAGTYFSYTSDASLLLPQHALTRRYTVSTWADFDAAPGGAAPTFGGFVSIVGTAREPTQVTVRAAGRVREGSGVAAQAAGATATFTLGEGDVVELLGGGMGDLTSTTVESSQPVAVFAGHDCARVPSDRVACDHLEEQLLPDEAWGRDYVVSALRDRGADVPSVVRILSGAAGNAITFEPEDAHEPATLARGQVLQFQTSRHFRVRGSGAFLVTQFMIGQGPMVGGIGSGDPSMVQEVPVPQYRDRYDFFAPSTYPQSFVNVVAPAGVELTLDDQPVRGPTEALGGYNVMTLPITAGPHRLRSGGRGVALKVYGSAPYASYMYLGGLDLRAGAP